MTLGEKLRDARLKSDLTLEEAAKYIKVTAQTLQKYEKGVISNVPSDKIEKLAEIYSITPAYVMGWEEQKDNMNSIVKERDDECYTIAAHHDGDWTEEELADIEKYKEFVRGRRPKKNTEI